MKRIGLWMAALIAVTVGGVYAAWTYAEGAVSPVESDKAIQMEGFVDAGAEGEYVLTQTANSNDTMFYFDALKSVVPDHAEAETDQHQAVLVTNCSIGLTFTANPNAEATVLANGLDTTITISITKPNLTVNLDGVAEKIFEKETPIVINIAGVGATNELTQETDGSYTATWTVGTDGKFSFAIDLATMKEIVKENFVVSDAIDLENVAEYKAFQTAIAGLTILTHVSETGAPVAQ